MRREESVLREECLTHISGHEPASVVITSAGNMVGAKHVAHVVINNDIPFKRSAVRSVAAY